MKNHFKVLYYPNSDCNLLTLGKAILVFDEITFLDHPSLFFTKRGSVGHISNMRNYAPLLKKEGYILKFISPYNGPITDEIQKLIDIDLSNRDFRNTFMRLVKNDPDFLISFVPKGIYGKYGDEINYRKMILETPENVIPKNVNEISSYSEDDGILPEILIAIKMSMDSYIMNSSLYAAIDQDLQLFGDSKAMDMLLQAKLSNNNSTAPRKQNMATDLVFTLLDTLIPDSAFKGKSIIDLVHFRVEMEKERVQFKEHILEIVSNFSDTKKNHLQKDIEKILYEQLLPEVRGYERQMFKIWNKFFKESIKAVFSDKHNITQSLLVTCLSHSLAAGVLAGIARTGTDIFPYLIDFLSNKKDLENQNPYIYLMKFK